MRSISFLSSLMGFGSNIMTYLLEDSKGVLTESIQILLMDVHAP